MNPHMGNRLTDEQMTDLLAPDADLRDDLGADLSDDLLNDAELQDLKAALGSFRSETLLWAERRSAAQPSLVPAARRNRLWAVVPQWSLAAVAVLTVATGIVHFTGNGTEHDAAVPSLTQASVPVQTVDVAQTDIAADNQLLSSIDEALSYRVVSPADEFGLKPSSAQAKTRTHPEAED